MFMDELEMGSLVLDIDGNRLDGKFLRETGAIDDSFTIIKGGAAEPLRVATFGLRNGNSVLRWKSIAGRTYQVQRSSTLDQAGWMPASEAITATGATTS